MISVTLPNDRQLNFSHVVFDYNGTLASAGVMSPAVRHKLAELAQKVHVAVITADTFGMAESQLQDMPGVELIILPEAATGKDKAQYVHEWGAGNTVAVGNGVNDQAMFMLAGLRICVLGPEGAHAGLLASASIVVQSPEDALALLLEPLRLVATLRP